MKTEPKTLPTAKLVDVPADKSAKTGPAAPPGASVLADMKKAEVDRRLDHALEESFPGSDPVSFDCD